MDICTNCTIEFVRSRNSGGKFCSKRCAAIYNNKIGVIGRERVKKKCLACNNKLFESKKTYCTARCKNDFIIQEWFKGNVSSSVWGHVPSLIRRFLLAEAGNKCTECGWCAVNPTTGVVPLEIDHIDGDSRNNKRENLKVLCPNCHSLTPTFRKLNKQGTRQRRA